MCIGDETMARMNTKIAAFCCIPSKKKKHTCIPYLEHFDTVDTVTFSHFVVTQLLMCVALLALGDRNCTRFPGCFRHGVDGEELGKRNGTFAGSGREVLKSNANISHVFIVNTSSLNISLGCCVCAA